MSNPQWPETSDHFPEPAKNFFEQHLEQVVNPTMSVLEQLVQIDLPMFCRNRVTTATCYEDDGNTQCHGNQYNKFYFVPIGRKFDDPFTEWTAFYHGNTHQMLVFSAEIVLRNSDHKKGRFSTHVDFAPFVIEDEVKSTLKRICYGPYIAKLDTRRIAHLLKLISETMEMKQLHEKVETVMNNLT